MKLLTIVHVIARCHNRCYFNVINLLAHEFNRKLRKKTVFKLMTLFVNSLQILCYSSRTCFLHVRNTQIQICFLDIWDTISHPCAHEAETSHCLLVIFLYQISISCGTIWRSYEIRILHNNLFHQFASKIVLCQSSDNVS